MAPIFASVRGACLALKSKAYLPQASKPFLLTAKFSYEPLLASLRHVRIMPASFSAYKVIDRGLREWLGPWGLRR